MGNNSGEGAYKTLPLAIAAAIAKNVKLLIQKQNNTYDLPDNRIGIRSSRITDYKGTA